MPTVPGFVDEDGAMGKRTTAAGAVSEFGCAGHDDQCGAGCGEDMALFHWVQVRRQDPS